MTAATEVWLFGSAARGDTDALSDIDVLVAGSMKDDSLNGLPYPADALSVVQYSWSELEHMAAYGSLFLHHVRLEGKPAQHHGSSRLKGLINALPGYMRTEHELDAFVRVLGDVEGSLVADHAPAFELSVVATALRHACILGCYRIGRPTFGRNSAFDVFLSAVGKSRLVAPAQRLYEFRLYEDGRGPAPFPPTTRATRSWLMETRDVIEDVRGVSGDQA